MIDLAMWGRAVTGMPHLDKQQWSRLDLVSRWLVATRSAVLVMTFTSAAIGGILAYKAGQFDALLWLACTLGLCLAHATNNLINDLTDSLKGVDRDNYFRTQYGPQPLESGLMTKRQLLAYIVVTGLAALAIGGYLVAVRGAVVAALLGAGAFFVLFYTFPLKYIGLGEPAVLLVWGPLMVGGTFTVVTGHWSTEVAWISIAFALAPTAVLFGKHIDKLDQDRAKGIRTMPVLLGERGSRWTVMAMLAGALVLTAVLVAVGTLGPAMLPVLGAGWFLRTVWQIYRQPRPAAPPAEFPPGVWPLWFVAGAFWYTRRYGGLFMLCLIADAFLG